MQASTHLTKEIYLKVFVALFLLTSLTFIQPYLLSMELSNTLWVQMFIACIKTVLIGSYYMHLKYESKLFKLIVLMALGTLAIFFIITASDAIFRNETFDLFQGD